MVLWRPRPIKDTTEARRKVIVLRMSPAVRPKKGFELKEINTINSKLLVKNISRLHSSIFSDDSSAPLTPPAKLIKSPKTIPLVTIVPIPKWENKNRNGKIRKIIPVMLLVSLLYFLSCLRTLLSFSVFSIFLINRRKKIILLTIKARKNKERNTQATSIILGTENVIGRYFGKPKDVSSEFKNRVIPFTSGMVPANRSTEYERATIAAINA